MNSETFLQLIHDIVILHERYKIYNTTFNALAYSLFDHDEKLTLCISFPILNDAVTITINDNPNILDAKLKEIQNHFDQKSGNIMLPD
jgi:hypothetical protein